MKKIVIIAMVLISLLAISGITVIASEDHAISHPFPSDRYNEHPAPTYVKNNDKTEADFVPVEKCLQNIVKTDTSCVVSKELKTWGQHLIDDKEEVVNYQMDPERMVRVIRTEFPDGLDTKAGFFNKAVLTTVFDAETGNLIESHVTGDCMEKR